MTHQPTFTRTHIERSRSQACLIDRRGTAPAKSQPYPHGASRPTDRDECHVTVWSPEAVGYPRSIRLRVTLTSPPLNAFNTLGVLESCLSQCVSLSTKFDICENSCWTLPPAPEYGLEAQLPRPFGNLAAGDYPSHSGFLARVCAGVPPGRLKGLASIY